jgi:hypothetical protein
MKVSELAEKIGLRCLNEYRDKDLEGVYISDMVSDIMTGARANGVLITLQTHKSLIAAANLVDVAAIVFVRGKSPSDEVIDLASKAGIGLFVSEDDAWSTATKFNEIGIR